jgi:hypothetical protein
MTKLQLIVLQTENEPIGSIWHMDQSNYLDYTSELAETMALAYRAAFISEDITFASWLGTFGAQLVRHPRSNKFTLYFKDSKLMTMFILKWVK